MCTHTCMYSLFSLSTFETLQFIIYAYDIHTCIYTYIHVYICICIHTKIYAFILLIQHLWDIYIHVYVYTHIHIITSICIYMYTFFKSVHT